MVRATALATYPGGHENPKTHELIWPYERSVITFGYSGCQDLGSGASEGVILPKPLDQVQVFSTARRLAEKFWNKDLIGGNSIALSALTDGLNKGAVEVSTVRDPTYYKVRHPNFVELYVAHEYKDGWDTVSIGWQGNF